MIIFRQITSAAHPDSKLIREIAQVFRQARESHLRFVIDLHSAEEDRNFLSGAVLPTNEVWVAEAEDAVIGFIAFAQGWINHLFVAPEFQHRGVGTRLLGIAKASSPSLQLWVFQANTPAIDFYQSQGFRVTRQTDGAGNEAKLPDAVMEWQAEGA